MDKKRADVVRIALVAVIVAAERRGIEAGQLLEHAADLLELCSESEPDKEALIETARAEIFDAHARLLASRS